MKVVNYILQIIAALLYSGIFSWLVVIAIAVPTGYILSLPWWAIILVFFVFGGIWDLIDGVINLLIGLITLPYAWIVKNNTVSLVISILTILIYFTSDIIKMWKNLADGTWNTIVLIIITLSLAGVGIALIRFLIGLRLESNEV